MPFEFEHAVTHRLANQLADAPVVLRRGGDPAGSFLLRDAKLHEHAMAVLRDVPHTGETTADRVRDLGQKVPDAGDLRSGVWCEDAPQAPILPTTIVMRTPCPHCATHTGRVEQRACTACVFCTACGAFCYNAPAKERRPWLPNSPVRCYSARHPE